MCEHDAYTYAHYGPIIGRQLASYDFYAPEYFRPEYEQLAKDPIVGSAISAHSGANALSDYLSALIQAQRLNTWMLDPAYGADFVGFRAEVDSIDGLVVVGAAGANLVAGTRRIPTRKAERESQSVISRRSAVGAGLIAIAATSVGTTTPSHGFGSAYDIEGMVREATVAEHLKNFCRWGVFPRGSRVLTIFPDAHWNGGDYHFGIDPLFRNDNLRYAVLGFAKTLFGHQFPGLFDARHYPYGQYPTTQIFPIDERPPVGAHSDISNSVTGL